MPTNYPAALDAFTNPDAGAGDTLDDPPHDDQHADANDAIEAIEAELGVNPRGSEADVRARLDAIESAADDLPKGVLGYAEVTSSQASLASETEIQTVEVNVDVGRRIKVSSLLRVATSVADVRSTVYLREGSTQLQASLMAHAYGGSSHNSHRAEVILTPSGGSHTYRLLVAPTDSGNVSTSHGSSSPGFIMVEDIGPA